MLAACKIEAFVMSKVARKGEEGKRAPQLLPPHQCSITTRSTYTTANCRNELENEFLTQASQFANESCRKGRYEKGFRPANRYMEWFLRKIMLPSVRFMWRGGANRAIDNDTGAAER